MKTRSDFYDEVVQEVRGSADGINKTESRIAETKRKINSGVFAPEYIKQELQPEVKRLERKVFNDKDAAAARVRKMCDDYIEELRADEELDPAALTDDIKLLQAGVKLTERDLKTLLSRNENNGTMTQILLRYAGEHDIPTDVHYIGNAPTIKLVNTLAESAQTALKWSQNYQVFDRLLGADSILAASFGGDE